ncbi:aminotransferase class I/II-fold pyridoxal phosphate-dependent enzyme [Psychromonas sp. KJ10-10]|uniref:aminotransferase class I/II-fold pyridoxal phosphate-dependent enzyme n=1 Tax=Psychromonas sp. KJ10-10 TaxID=3391823 RepID=UPI0039B641BE
MVARHNPTGIDPTLAQWQQFADFCQQRKLIPFIDMAYQGFADNPDDDAAGLRLIVEQCELVLLATSCSKNMGLYCERTGATSIITQDKKQHKDLRSMLEIIARANYSMPPNHGSAIASLLLNNPKPWLEELSVCRDRIANIRQLIGDKLVAINAPDSLNAIAKQKGMFSMLPLTALQMNKLRDQFAIYGLPNGRINLAGLKTSQVDELVKALIAVI